MRLSIRFVALLALSCAFVSQARAGITITDSPISRAQSFAYGYGPGGPDGPIYRQYQSDSGPASATTGFDFDSFDGFSGNVSASSSLTETHLLNSLLVSVTNASSVVFANTSPDGYSSVFGEGSSFMSFSTDQAEQATLTWNPSWSLGTWNAGSGAAQAFSYLYILGDSGVAIIQGKAFSNDGVTASDQLFGYSTTSTWGGGNTITLDLTPGTYSIQAGTQSNAYFYGAGSISDPDASGFGTIAINANSSVPEPSTLVMSSILLGIFGTVWSYSRLKQTAVAA